MIRDWMPDILIVLGLLLMTVGLSMIYVPMAYVVCGVILFIMGMNAAVNTPRE